MPVIAARPTSLAQRLMPVIAPRPASQAQRLMPVIAARPASLAQRLMPVIAARPASLAQRLMPVIAPRPASQAQRLMPVIVAWPSQNLTLKVNLEALMTSMMLKAAQLMSYPSICNCYGTHRKWHSQAKRRQSVAALASNTPSQHTEQTHSLSTDHPIHSPGALNVF
ncbi:hypothetical protein P7K49_032844 [Saguinus oedipus]|uniref:Uncharacterized protein n=1 Tax=Saguinus oedipus TaxID=9490 RepID=A0ABQ9TQ81_SAGOE|nr:hypothetical protein P7K49_032844 [Saguinus oedipus]